MRVTEAKLLEILRNVSQFIIPNDQRTYSWTQKECQQLWTDILRAGSTDEIGVHFIGGSPSYPSRQATSGAGTAQQRWSRSRIDLVAITPRS